MYAAQSQMAAAWVTPLVNTNDRTIYIGVGEVYRSTDEMGSWTKISNFGWGWGNGSGTNNRITGLGTCFSDPNYIYASETWSNHIQATSNGGSSWKDISSYLPDKNISYIAVHAKKPQTLAITMAAYGDGNKVFVSTNGGGSWSDVSNGLPNLPALCAVWDEDNDDLYIGMDVGVYYKGSQMSEFVPYFNELPNVLVTELDIHKGLNKIRASTYGRGLWEAPLYGVNAINHTIHSFKVFKPTQVTVYSLNGKKICSYKANGSKELSSVKVPLTTGVYLLKYSVSGKAHYSKLCIKR